MTDAEIIAAIQGHTYTLKLRHDQVISLRRTFNEMVNVCRAMWEVGAADPLALQHCIELAQTINDQVKMEIDSVVVASGQSTQRVQ